MSLYCFYQFTHSHIVAFRHFHIARSRLIYKRPSLTGRCARRASSGRLHLRKPGLFAVHSSPDRCEVQHLAESNCFTDFAIATASPARTAQIAARFEDG